MLDDISNFIAEFWRYLQRPDAQWQIGVLLLCLVAAYIASDLVRRRAISRRQAWRLGQGGLKRLTFPLLSDVDASVCKAYGVYKQKSLYGRTYLGIERTTVIIDEAGRIAKIFPKVKVEGHTQEVLQALEHASAPACRCC